MYSIPYMEVHVVQIKGSKDTNYTINRIYLKTVCHFIVELLMKKNFWEPLQVQSCPHEHLADSFFMIKLISNASLAHYNQHIHTYIDMYNYGHKTPFQFKAVLAMIRHLK